MINNLFVTPNHQFRFPQFFPRLEKTRSIVWWIDVVSKINRDLDFSPPLPFNLKPLRISANLKLSAFQPKFQLDWMMIAFLKNSTKCFMKILNRKVEIEDTRATVSYWISCMFIFFFGFFHCCMINRDSHQFWTLEYRGSPTYTKITNTVSTNTFFGLCTCKWGN